VAALTGSCGGSDSEPSADEAKARQTAAAFYAALERKDGERACALLTPAERRDADPEETPPRPCEEALVDMFGGQPVPPLDTVEIDGDEAVIQVPAGPGSGEGGNVTLVRDGDRWLLSSY
jgi:hypothetical protein